MLVGGKMFEHNNMISYSDIKTKYGTVRIKNIVFSPELIENELPELVFKEENLKYMFAEDELTIRKHENILKRFIPREERDTDIDDYLTRKMEGNNNANFYSFLSEGILSLVFRDVYNYKLAKGVIDIRDTLVDTHTGVDSCMYSLEENTIILGEAKFYTDLSKGLRSIISDFKTKNIKNKLTSLQVAAENNDESYDIVIKNLSLGKYDGLSLKQFLQQRIIFAGFVLHSEERVTLNYDKNFYDKFEITINDLVDNINECLKTTLREDNFEIVFIHLPIKNKKTLIYKMIHKAIVLLNSKIETE